MSDASPSAPAGGPRWAPGYRHLTLDEPPIAFSFRSRPEDFVVEELPLVAPTGSGDHVWFEFEKRGLSTLAALAAIGRVLGVDASAFGFAGRKDAFAVTRQWASIEHVDPSALQGLELPGVRVLRHGRAPRKLRLSQLAGNRFRLRLVGLERDGVEVLRRVVKRLEREGMPNYYGSQRFGNDGGGFELGRRLVTGDAEGYLERWIAEEAGQSAAAAELARVAREGTWSEYRALKQLAAELPAPAARVALQLARRPKNAAAALRAIDKRARRFQVSAFQSLLFNRTLAARMAAGLSLLEGQPGDVVLDPGSGRSSLLPPDDPPGAHARGRVPTGPLPGRDAPLAEGRPGELERAALHAEGVTREGFASGLAGGPVRGARRPLCVPVGELEIVDQGPGALQLRFDLPPGSFATTLLEELSKTFRADPGPESVRAAPKRGPCG